MKIRVRGVSFFCKFVKFWQIFGKFSAFKPEETLEFPNFDPGDARGRPRGSPRGSPGPHFSRKSLFSSVFTVCTRLKKSVHTGVHTGIFRHFDPKIHGFLPCSFFTRVCTRGVRHRCARHPILTKTLFSSGFTFCTRLQKKCARVYTPVFFDIPTLKITVSIRVHFLPGGTPRGCVTEVTAPPF